jgi:hypothetical protein
VKHGPPGKKQRKNKLAGGGHSKKRPATAARYNTCLFSMFSICSLYVLYVLYVLCVLCVLYVLGTDGMLIKNVAVVFVSFLFSLLRFFFLQHRRLDRHAKKRASPSQKKTTKRRTRRTKATATDDGRGRTPAKTIETPHVEQR